MVYDVRSEQNRRLSEIGGPMASDDFDVIAFKVLSYLYGCLKAGKRPDLFWRSVDLTGNQTRESTLRARRPSSWKGEGTACDSILPGGSNEGYWQGHGMDRRHPSRRRHLLSLQTEGEVMALSDARKRANAKYAKSHVKQVGLKFYPAEEDVYAWLKSQENVQGYVKSLIRADMEARKGRG